MKPSYQSAAAMFDAFRSDVLSGTPPVTYPLGYGDLAGIDFGPGRLLLIGGSPGAGKTALAMQCVFDAMTIRADLRFCLLNPIGHRAPGGSAGSWPGGRWPGS